ncbi:hypothetical protein N7471_013067 [Penicillium samsonianum]|uniref:uncharacterized protein n=1 Tax=Penicillium samsonianum TaxID=1882272 RepID=UPI00254965A0|nr:uncharacterized protein N7471_013067 [Penicillium samsonianum]KAJ6119116.1 hypothetical protein N7471_013067 [Penicillium samsonianum]
MHFLSAIAIFVTLGAVSAAPNGGTGSQCTTEQANKCCTGLTKGVLNIDILPALCLRTSELPDCAGLVPEAPQDARRATILNKGDRGGRQTSRSHKFI